MISEPIEPIEIPERFRSLIVTDDFDRYGLQPGQPTPTPRYLQIELTDRCNLACAGCMRAVHDSSGAELDLDTFTKLLDQLPELDHVSFVGAGEAMIVRDFPAYVQACTERGVFSSTSTNGLLVRRRLGPVLAAGLGMIAISVDGADDTTLGAMRSGLRASQLSMALCIAADLVADYPAKLSVAVTLSSTNIDSFAEIVAFVADHSVPRMSVESLHHWGDDKTLNEQSLFSLDPSVVVPHLERGLERAVESGIELTVFDYRRLADPHAGNAVCPWPWDASYVTRDGDVTPCCVHMEASPETSLGNIRRTPMADVWSGDRYAALRGSFLGGPTWTSCDGCVYRMEFGRV